MLNRDNHRDNHKVAALLDADGIVTDQNASKTNETLIASLKTNQVKVIYFFTTMTHNTLDVDIHSYWANQGKTSAYTREVIIQEFKHRGFDVRGVIILHDCADENMKNGVLLKKRKISVNNCLRIQSKLEKILII